MNVLVYDGPGVSQTSVAHTLNTLKSLLSPNYTVQTIKPQSFKQDPWATNCALFVLPGGRDLPYLSTLGAKLGEEDRLASYVKNGGSFLGLCAGAYYACNRVEWEKGTTMEVIGERPLGFFKGVGRGCVYPGFEYETEFGARATTLNVRGELYEGIYYNGGGEFVDAHQTPDTEVLAEYVDGEGKGKVAGVTCQVGQGKAVLWAIHPEYPLTLEPALSAVKITRHDISDSKHIEQLESRRWTLMKDTLRILGLHLPKEGQHLHILPQFLTSTSYNEAAIIALRDSPLTATIQEYPLATVSGNTDTFEIRTINNENELLINEIRRGSKKTEEELPRQIIAYPDGTIPSKTLTPHFDLAQYYTDLKTQYESSSSNSTDDSEEEVRMGEMLLYGEVVSSTQTLLDKNPAITTLLPTPLLSLATFQLSGRGRGSNIWLSPTGCLQFSLLLRVPTRILPATKLVFIQYVFALAVVEACNSPSVLGENLGKRVRLKWPNDIYVITPGEEMKKIGGILVNTSFSGDCVDTVIGCGLNVLTPSPLTSLSHLIPPGLSSPSLTMERTAATIMSVFNGMWTKFHAAKGSFEPFIDLYLQKWLHSDQLVTLTTQEPHIPVRIVGITMDYGFLRTMPETKDRWSAQGGTYIDLQPDGNSFDMMAGLIKTKT